MVASTSIHMMSDVASVVGLLGSWYCLPTQHGEKERLFLFLARVTLYNSLPGNILVE